MAVTPKTGKRQRKRPARGRATTAELKHSRDLEIAAGIAEGKTLPAIAAQLGVSPSVIQHRAGKPEVKSLLVEFLERKSEQITRAMDHLADHIDTALDPAKVPALVSPGELAASRVRMEAGDRLIRMADAIDRAQARLQQQEFLGAASEGDGLDLEEFALLYRVGCIRDRQRAVGEGAVKRPDPDAAPLL